MELIIETWEGHEMDGHGWRWDWAFVLAWLDMGLEAE